MSCHPLMENVNEKFENLKMGYKLTMFVKFRMSIYFINYKFRMKIDYIYKFRGCFDNCAIKKISCMLSNNWSNT